MIYTPMSAVATAACMGCYVPLTGQSAASAGHTSYRNEYRADYEPYQPLEAIASYPVLSSLAPLSGRRAMREADAYHSGSSSAPSTAPSIAPSTASSICSDDWSSSSSNASGRSTGSWLSKAISRAVGISSTKRSSRGRPAGVAAAN
uniref:Uncharacterized protein n=1 Tax=Tetradesmus obliquus TaxID=3088 RepID=A0A383VGY1_TETOB|eukprot:jgi/Sobl393_1/1582/SZX64193.1